MDQLIGPYTEYNTPIQSRRAVQQLKMLPRADTKSHFGTLARPQYPILIVLDGRQMKKNVT